MGSHRTEQYVMWDAQEPCSNTDSALTVQSAVEQGPPVSAMMLALTDMMYAICRRQCLSSHERWSTLSPVHMTIHHTTVGHNRRSDMSADAQRRRD